MPDGAEVLAVNGENKPILYIDEVTTRGETLARYVFVLTYRETTVRLQLRDGIVRGEFIALGRKADRSPEDELRLTYLKQEMAQRLLAMGATEVYDVTYEPAEGILAQWQVSRPEAVLTAAMGSRAADASDAGA